MPKELQPDKIDSYCITGTYEKQFGRLGAAGAISDPGEVNFEPIYGEKIYPPFRIRCLIGRLGALASKIPALAAACGARRILARAILSVSNDTP